MTVSNPFCTRFIKPGAIAYRFAGNRYGNLNPVASLAADLRSSGIGLIVGPHGSGKSTLIATLMPILEYAYPAVIPVQLRETESQRWLARGRHSRKVSRQVANRQNELVDRGLLVIDGAEQLSRFAWSRTLRIARQRQQTVLATAHQPLTGGHVLHRTGNTPAMIRWLTESLVSQSPQPMVSLVSDELSRRDLSKLTNVRDLWFELYDVVQPQISA